MRLRSSLLTTLLCALLVSSVLAQSGYPQPRDNYVNDFANVLSADAEAYIRTQLEAVEARANIEMSVATIDSISEYDRTARTFEAFATGLFNTWGIGDAARGDGILLLVAVEDRDVRVELGEGYADAQDNDAQDILEENILPAFRRGDFQTGIVNGTHALINEFTGVLPPLPPNGVTQPPQTFTQEVRDDEQHDNSGGALLVLILVVLGGGGLLWFFSWLAASGAEDGWASDAGNDDDWDDSSNGNNSSGYSRRRSWSSPISDRSSSSSRSSARRSSFGGGRSKGGGASGKW